MAGTTWTTCTSARMPDDRVTYKNLRDAGLWGIVKWKLIRDVTMFTAGLSGFTHEVFEKGQERPMLLAACLALMGVPVMLRKDEKDKDEK